MTTRVNLTVVALALGALGLTGCSAPSVEASTKIEHAKVKDISGSPLKQVTLTQQAQTRLGIKTVAVTKAAQAQAGQANLTVIPYSAVLYDVEGKAWAYTSTTAGSYQRESLTIQDIAGPSAYLTSGPSLGTAVVAVGAAELYGAELGVGK